MIIKTPFLGQKITSVGKDMEELEPWCAVGGHIKWCRHYRKQKRFQVELPCEPATPLQGNSPIRTESKVLKRGTCTLMFTAALFITARKWKPPKRPIDNKWTNKMWYNNGVLFSLKKQGNSDMKGKRETT